MSTRGLRIPLALFLVALPTTLPGPATAGGVGATDLVRVTKVLVNRLGGVSVVGDMSCAGTAQAIRAGGFTMPDENGDPVEVLWREGDSLVMLTNPDQYTVSQPAGRRMMVQVTHVSSQAAPCYTDLDAFPDGTDITCQPGASTCPWATGQFGYDPALFGPLFDYSAVGKFKTGSLNVSGYSSGLYLTVVHDDGSTTDYGDGDAFFRPYSQVLKAVGVR